MSSISSCPKCQQQVLLPPGASASAVVRCPLCEAEFPLEEILAGLPPMLIVVESGVAAVPAGMAGHAAGAFDTDDMLLTGSGAHPVEQGASDEYGFGMTPELNEADLDPDEVDTVLDEERRPAIRFGERLMSPGEEPTSQFAPFAAPTRTLDGVNTYREVSTDLEGEEIELDHGGHDEHGYEHVPHNEEEDNPFREGAVAIKPGKAKKRREPSMIGTLIGVVGGGVVGSGIAVMVLIWFAGPSNDFAVKAAQYLPKWMLPASFSETAAEEPAGSGFAKSFSSAPNPQQTVAQAKPSKPAKKNDFGEMQLNVPALPDNSGSPSQTTANKLPTELDLSSDSKPEPSLDLPTPSLDNPLITPPVIGPAPSKPAMNKPAATVPAETDTAKPEPAPKTDDIPAPAENVGLKESPVHTTDELIQATQDVRDASKQLSEAVAAGSDEVKKFRLQFYLKVYKLGEVITFLEKNPADPQTAELQETALQMVLEMAGDPDKLREIGLVAGQWLSRPHPGNDGVLLSGTVQSAAKQGKLYETKIKLTAGEKIVTVVSAHDPQLKADDPALVLGSVVDEPAQKLYSYMGQEPTVIWNGLALKLATP